MDSMDLKPEDMAKRIARFQDLKPYKQSIMENTGIPAEAVEIVSAKSVYPVMAPEGWKGRAAVAPVKGKDGLTVAIAECPPGLAPLVAADLADTVIAAGDPLPAFDAHAPFLDLPRIFGTNLGNLPNAVPYLAVDAARRQEWRQRLAPLTGSGRPISRSLPASRGALPGGDVWGGVEITVSSNASIGLAIA